MKTKADTKPATPEKRQPQIVKIPGQVPKVKVTKGKPPEAPAPPAANRIGGSGRHATGAQQP